MGTPVPRRDKETPKINNEVITYRLSPEEIAARYGSPVNRDMSQNRVTAAKLLEAARSCDGYEEAAEMLGISVHSLKYEFATKNIQPRWGESGRKDDEEMAAFEVYKPDVEIGDMLGDLPSDEPAGMDTAEDRAAIQKKKTRKEILWEKLTKEQYVVMKEQGLTDTAVLEQIGLAGWVDVLTILKRKWGLVGVVFRKAQPEQPENQLQPTNQEAPQDDKNARSSKQEEDSKVIGLEDTYPQACKANTGLVDIMPDNLTKGPFSDTSEYGFEIAVDSGKVVVNDIDDEQVEWAVPFVSTRDYPVLVVAADNIRFNTAATCTILDAGIKTLRVGVAKGRIILKPDRGQGCYKIGRSGSGPKGSSTKIGGRALCKFIISKGIVPGKYVLNWNEDKGWWETGGREE